MDMGTLVLVGGTWFVAIEGITIFLASQLLPKTKRANFLNKLFKKKRLGIVRVYMKGRSLKTYITDYTESYARVKNKVFFYNPERVYMEDNVPVTFYDESDAFEAKMLQSNKISTDKTLDTGIKGNKKRGFGGKILGWLTDLDEMGVGTIERVYLEPIDLKKSISAEKGNDPQRDPEMINQIFLKQKALAENDAWNKIIGSLKKWIVIGAAASVAAAVMCFQILQEMGVV